MLFLSSVYNFPNFIVLIEDATVLFNSLKILTNLPLWIKGAKVYIGMLVDNSVSS